MAIPLTVVVVGVVAEEIAKVLFVYETAEKLYEYTKDASQGAKGDPHRQRP